ncbi:MAG TPA: 5'-nucleotidase C-terminal domain-containing protein, partial [Acidobacteriota bacterium]|nr:5'-nucleotidase C-terminal domain-containing protein [Acidobacteriota bacterium]
GGMARMAALIKKFRATQRNVLALNAGDVFVGSFMFNKYLGWPELKIMEGLYDAMTPGNHEFDLGISTLEAVLGGALPGTAPIALPILNANYNFGAVGGFPASALGSLTQPRIIRDLDGVKVGIFGLGNEDATNFGPEMIARFAGANLWTVAGTQAATLRAAGCQVVICLSHLGTMVDIEGLSQVPGIDIIVGGHSHDLFKRAVFKNGKIIVQAGSHSRWLGELRVAVQAGGGVRFLSWRAQEVDKTVRPDRAIEAQLAALQAGVEADTRFGDVFTEPVAYAVRNIDNDWPATGPNRDSALGILVADAMKAALLAATGVPPVDCVLDPMGYTEFGIPVGKVVGNDILRAVPYGYDPASGLGFKLYVVPLDGATILALLEYTVTYVEYTQSLSVQPSGLTFAYDSSQPPSPGLGQFSRLDLGSVKIGGENVYPANLGKVYFIGMTDGVYSFLDRLTNNGMPPNWDPGIFEYNAVRDFMQSLRFVRYESQGRVIDTAPATAAPLLRK